MIFEDIEVVVWMKRITVIKNGQTIPWSCYDINVVLNELRQTHSEELVCEIEDYIYENCNYITKGARIEPELFEEEKQVDEILKDVRKVSKKKPKKGSDQYRLEL